MAKQYFFHIGLPKSATSYLQKNYFPRLGIKYLGKHYDSEFDQKNASIDFEVPFKKLFTTQPYSLSEEDFTAITEAMGAGEKFLYSNEGMVGSYYESFRNLYQIAHNLKKGFPDAKIILVIRRQDTFIESLYRQAIRNGTWISIKNFIGFKKGKFHSYRLGYKDHLDIETLNYHDLVNFYNGLFGEANLLVLPYEMLREDESRFLTKISDFIGVPTVSIKPAPMANVSDSYIYLQIKRFLNIFIYKKQQSLFSKLLRLDLLVARINRLPFTRNYLSPTLKGEVKQYFSEGNKQLSEENQLELERYHYW